MKSLASRRLALAATSIVLGLSLSACGGSDTKRTVSAPNGDKVSVESKGGELPDGFPKDEVPLIDGAASGAKVDSESIKGFSVAVRTDDKAEDAFTEAKGLLVNKGFTEQMVNGTTSGAYASAAYSVILAVVAADGNTIVSYTVTPAE